MVLPATVGEEHDDVTPDIHHMPDSRVSLGQIGHLASGRYVEIPVIGMADVFRCVWFRHVGEDGSVLPIRVIPDNCADFIVTDDGRTWFVGPATRTEFSSLPPGTVVRGLRIQPHALQSVIDADPPDLVDRHAAFDDLLPSRSVGVLANALLTGKLDHRLLRQVWPSVTTDDRVTRGIRLLASTSDVAVDDIARECGMSARHFRRSVRQVSGLTPKTIQRVGRLHRALDLARVSPSISLGEIAVTAGFADQSHFARDAHSLAELTPRQLVQTYR
jgi:AraC-like DNA-binding protein